MELTRVAGKASCQKEQQKREGQVRGILKFAHYHKANYSFEMAALKAEIILLFLLASLFNRRSYYLRSLKQ